MPLRSRRHRRLAFVGILWALLLLVVSTALFTPAPAARPSPYPPRWATHLDRTLGGVVDAVSGRPNTAVWCWSVADWRLQRDPWPGRVRLWSGPWGGYVYGGAVQLAPYECAVLKLLRSSRSPVWRWTNPKVIAWSVYVLAHESVHVSGYRSERRATCWGLQRVARVARLLGRTGEESRFLARLAWERWYPASRRSYKSRQCRDGGRLDLHPKSDVWP